MPSKTSTNAYHYQISGLRIRSEFRLARYQTSQRPPNVTIGHGSVPLNGVQGADADHWRYATTDHVAFGNRVVGRFLVRGGSEVVVEPTPEATEGAIRPFLLGSAMGYLLHQQGRLVLHASSVAVAGGCVAFLGRRGMGKSTLAAFLQHRGYPIVCDDICAVTLSQSHPPLVSPGYPQLKLFADSIEALGQDSDTFTSLDSPQRKYGPRRKKCRTAS